MREQLLIFYTPQQATIEAQLLDEQGRAAASPWRGGLADLAPLAEGRRLKVIVPGESVVLHQAQIPVMRSHKALAAVPYILEDQLLEDVDDLHFALAANAGVVDVASVAQENMQAWYDAFRQQGLQPQLMVPDTLAIPYVEQHWTLWLESERVLVRSARQQGWVCQAQHLLPLLQQALLQSDNKPEAIHVYDWRQPTDSQLLVQLQGLDEQLEVINESLDEKARAMMATTVAQHSGLNLLQGPYRFKQQIGKLLQPWRFSLYGLAALLLLGVLSSVVDFADLYLQRSRLESHIETLVQANFPNIQNINFYQLDKRIKQEQAQMQREGVKQGYFYITATVGKYIQAQPQLNLRQLNYRNDGLELQIETDDSAALDEMVGRLRSEAKLKVEVSRRDGMAIVKVGV